MPSPKRWLQSSANGADDGGVGNGATGSPAEEVVLEAMVPGAAETTVAESPNEGMVPNVEMADNAEGEGRRQGLGRKGPGMRLVVWTWNWKRRCCA